jgi:hypothetical protein
MSGLGYLSRLSLLRSWLTPEQQKQWDARGAFEVIGNDTGTRYRITYRAVMNVHQLDPDGHPVQQWCFAPGGRLADGDVLLAQKIALETMETKASSTNGGLWRPRVTQGPLGARSRLSHVAPACRLGWYTRCSELPELSCLISAQVAVTRAHDAASASARAHGP